jgi:hypothetical protein
MLLADEFYAYHYGNQLCLCIYLCTVCVQGSTLVR